MFRTLINYDDSMVLAMEDIKSIAVKQIMVTDQGDMAYAIVCYPGPGTGYVVARFNEEEDAKKAFSGITDALMDTSSRGSFIVNSKYVQPEKKEAEVIGEASVEEAKEDSENN